MIFDLAHHGAKFANFNARSEQHGPDRVPAADLKMETSISQLALYHFHEDLASALFRVDSMEPTLPGVESVATKLRFPKIPALAWESEIVGATFTVHRGVNGRSDIVLGGCTIDRFVLEPVEGGRVNLTFRVKCAPHAVEAGALYELTQQQIEISVESPKAEPDPL